MNRLDIVRAWKDEEYRMSLTEAERASLPQNPAGMVEMNAAELDGAAGGNGGGFHNTSPVVCQPIGRTVLCPNRSYLVRACPRTLAQIFCPRPTLNVACPKITIVGCPQVTLAGCPQVTLACPQVTVTIGQ